MRQHSQLLPLALHFLVAAMLTISGVNSLTKKMVLKRAGQSTWSMLISRGNLNYHISPDCDQFHLYISFARSYRRLACCPRTVTFHHPAAWPRRVDDMVVVAQGCTMTRLGQACGLEHEKGAQERLQFMFLGEIQGAGAQDKIYHFFRFFL